MEKEQDIRPVSSRLLLKRLREIMSSDIDVQGKLNRIVQVVASEMHTDVCSFYLLQPGDILELFATYGLKYSAVHETSLRLGEGLIGEIAVQKKALSFEDIGLYLDGAFNIPAITAASKGFKSREVF